MNSIKSYLLMENTHKRASTWLLYSVTSRLTATHLTWGLFGIHRQKSDRTANKSIRRMKRDSKKKSIIMNNARRMYVCYMLCTLCYAFFVFNSMVFIVWGIFICSISNYLIEGSIRNRVSVLLIA